MKAKLHIKLWGTRGSLPSPRSPFEVSQKLKEVVTEAAGLKLKNKQEIDHFIENLPLERGMGYGGDTTCVEVNTRSTQIIIDCGTGLRRLGYEMLKGPAGKGKAEIHILMTHFHWDHLMGLPFFAPIFIPGNIINFYAVQPELSSVIELVFHKPMFPVEFGKLPAKMKFFTIPQRKKFKIDDVEVIAYKLDHPDPCWGYKISNGGSAFSHCVDNEATRVSKSELGPDYAMYQGIDLMIWDAQYTLMEAVEKVDWGHAAATMGLDLAMAEEIRKVLFVHHDPAANDEKITSAAEQVKHYEQSQRKTAKRNGEKFFKVDWQFVHDGFEIEI